MSVKRILFYVVLCLLDNIGPLSYMIHERPVTTYVNDKFAKYFIINSRRISRQDPRYYVNIYVETLVIMGNNVKMDFYFYQFLTNRYRPSFVELHFGFCDLTDKDPIFGSQLKRNLSNLTCPYPPGKYNLTNMAVPFVPKNFPFQRGRIYLNITFVAKGKSTLYASAYIDMEIKNIIQKDNNKS